VRDAISRWKTIRVCMTQGSGAFLSRVYGLDAMLRAWDIGSTVLVLIVTSLVTKRFETLKQRSYRGFWFAEFAAFKRRDKALKMLI